MQHENRHDGCVYDGNMSPAGVRESLLPRPPTHHASDRTSASKNVQPGGQ
jgi:hypothetical protein